MSITFNEITLHDQQLNTIITECERHNIDARFAIVQGYFETKWGTVGAGKTNNNWAGLTWLDGYKGNPDAKKSQGGNRPADEGGNYVLYPTVDDGIKDWIYLLRPGNLYNVSDATTITDYVKGLFKNGGTAKADYAASGYANYLKNMTELYDAMKHLLSNLGGKTMTTKTAVEVVEHARKYLGTTESSSNFTKIINTYNNYLPLAQGVKMQRDWEWCACFVSFIAIELSIVDLIGTEIGVERFINNIFKKKGIWIEDGTITPVKGDIITWNWDKKTQPNDGFADHIGFVDYVKNGYIYTIEGNTNERVGANTFKVGDGRIRGYARPKYASTNATEGSTAEHKVVNQHLIVKIDNLRAFDIPSSSGSIVENIKKNYVKNIDLIVEAEGYTWGGWISSADNKRRWTTLETSDGSRKFVEIREGTIGHGGKTIQEYEAALKQEVTPAPDQTKRELKDNEFILDGKIYEVNEAK